MKQPKPDFIDPATASDRPCPLKHDNCKGESCPVWRVTTKAICVQAPGNIAAHTGAAPIMKVDRYYGYCGLGMHPGSLQVLYGQ